MDSYDASVETTDPPTESIVPLCIDRNNQTYPMPGKVWRNEQGKLHRDNDRPALVTPFFLQWCQNGKSHRDNDLPAFIRDGHLIDNDPTPIQQGDGVQEWWQHGKRSRDNGKPALIRIYKGVIVREEWWVDDVKVDPPALIKPCQKYK